MATVLLFFFSVADGLTLLPALTLSSPSPVTTPILLQGHLTEHRRREASLSCYSESPSLPSWNSLQRSTYSVALTVFSGSCTGLVFSAGCHA